MHFYDQNNGSVGQLVNGSITAGGTAQNAFGDTVPPENGFEILNTSANDLWINFDPTNNGGVAAVNKGYRLVTGQAYQSPSLLKPQSFLSIFGATTAQTFVVLRW